MQDENAIPEHFDVSSGLKSVLGRELITDDEVAIFELVKNSFDAEAKQVDIYFGDDKIVVADNGHGMTAKDIREKWLSVAYSSKRRQNDFRDDIANRRKFAGSKGIGRISTDRLGELVTLQTRSKFSSDGVVLGLQIDWSLFDVDHKERFEDIPVKNLPNSDAFKLPKELPVLSCGTVITIQNLLGDWDRDELLSLKSNLSKLINPFGSDADAFQIVMHVPSEKKEDERLAEEYEEYEEEVELTEIVNGPVGNFIFETLEHKTTHIKVWIETDKDEVKIFSELHDRGELIYKIMEPNPYELLEGADFEAHIFFLNRSAKTTFTRRMGIQPVNFGSVFLFRNGFRVFPVGERNDDWFSMDRRKSQGYARFLGTRELIGRIDVSGTDENFAEASSRNTGLIETEAVQQLRICFLEHCLKRLENYVVPVTFKDKEDKNVDDISRLKTDPGRERVTNVVSKLADSKNIVLLDYSKELVRLLDERSAKFEESLVGLRVIAEKTKDKSLFGNIEEAEKKFLNLKLSEEKARKQAKEESEARRAAELRAANAEKKTEATEEQLKEEKKRNLFLTSNASLDKETIQNLHHQITIYAVDIQQRLENFIVKLSDDKLVERKEILSSLEGISLLNSRVLSIAKFATKANFRLDSEEIEEDLVGYVEQYLEAIAKDLLFGTIDIQVKSDDVSFVRKFKPIDVSIVIDNLIANARKARATSIIFEFTHPEKNVLHLEISDNGRGLERRVSEPQRIFEKGFTTTDGSGLGLYHIQHVLGEMNGTIEVEDIGDAKDRRGMHFLIRISS